MRAECWQSSRECDGAQERVTARRDHEAREDAADESHHSSWAAVWGCLGWERNVVVEGYVVGDPGGDCARDFAGYHPLLSFNKSAAVLCSYLGMTDLKSEAKMAKGECDDAQNQEADLDEFAVCHAVA